MSLLIDSQYFPSINYSKILFKNKNIIFNIYDNHFRNSLINRTCIAGSTGVLRLSVPLIESRNTSQLIKDLRICYKTNWQAQHWRTLTTCYNRSPYFDYYADELEAIFQIRYEYLIDLNMSALDWLNKVLKLGLQFQDNPGNNYPIISDLTDMGLCCERGAIYKKSICNSISTGI